jgi:hypothetical protein
MTLALAVRRGVVLATRAFDLKALEIRIVAGARPLVGGGEAWLEALELVHRCPPAVIIHAETIDCISAGPIRGASTSFPAFGRSGLANRYRVEVF